MTMVTTAMRVTKVLMPLRVMTMVTIATMRMAMVPILEVTTLIDGDARHQNNRACDHTPGNLSVSPVTSTHLKIGYS